MALHTTRRQFFSVVGMAATAGTVLYTPGQSPGAPTLDTAGRFWAETQWYSWGSGVQRRFP